MEPVIKNQDKGVQKQPVDGLGIAGLVTGILSIAFFWFWPLAIILGVLGLVFGIISYRKNKAGVALAGAICGGVGIVAAIAFIIIIVVLMENGDSVLREVERNSNYYY